MKLRTRLIIAFCAMVIGPVLLISLFVFGFGRAKIRTAERTLGIEFSMHYLVNSAQTVNESTTHIWEDLHRQAQEDPDRFRTFSYLQGINEQLAEKLSFLLLISNGEISYQGKPGDLSTLTSQVPGYGEGEENGRSVYVDGEYKAILKQVDLKFTDGTLASAYLVTAVTDVMPGVRGVIIQAIAGLLLILLIMALAMTYWIYRGVNAPISKLRVAARRIAAGDLDFTLEAEGEGEISDLTRDFESMRRKLKETELEKERFDKENRELISNISHDLKTPITTIKGYVEGIIDGVADTPEKMDHYIRTIYNKTNDMDRLINELTFYSKIDSNRIPYNFTRLNVADFFEDCAEELCMDLEEKNIRFTYENQVAKDTRIIADPEQLKRVIDNIVGNSVKYMDKPKGTIDLRILDVGDFIQVEIEDNGKGIDPRDLVNIFDRFYRTDTARTNTENGSGIGLSIVKKIIEDHSGQIWAGSNPGKGTVMHFVIRKYQETAV